MEFRKEVKIENAGNEIAYHSKLMSIGSCFSENIGGKLATSKFEILQNPQGIIFNPLALANIFDKFDASDIFTKNKQSFSWRHHSSISSMDESTLIESIEKRKHDVIEYLKSATHVFVTFGSAWWYRHIETNRVVANCHKMPQQDFVKELASVNQIIKSWSSILSSYPHINWVFTVSPVRHWKDGVRENNVSKGVLHQAINELIKIDNANYFPSYEIVMDELRDYRFFKSDMLHPNEIAIDYVWEKFMESYFSEKTKVTLTEVRKLNKLMSHKVMSNDSEEVRKYEELLSKQKVKVDLLLKVN